MIRVEELILPLEGESPAGQNMEYDPLYLEMDTLAIEVPDSQMGDSKIEGRGPDWKNLSKNCLELWKKTRDLRVAVYLVIAEAVTGGLAGLAGALKLPLFLAKELWDVFYPQLDPDDEEPIERLNILSMLSPQAGAINDPIMFIPRFRDLRLVPSLKYTLRDLLISANEIEVSGGERVDPQLIGAELMNVPIQEVQTQAAFAHEARDLVTALCDEMSGKMKGGYTLDMSALIHELDRLGSFYDTHLQNFSALAGDEPAAETAAEGDNTPGKEQSHSGGNFTLLSYRANTRAEALLLLKKGAEYFQFQEPSSPIPLLINRAMRFAEMNFIDLIEDIAPDAVARGRDVLGLKKEENS
ncbi:MAG: type VI secretion system protein TssA [Treponema sp.]|jgi:type VI secretion system ImpA family protein|nr:type VI secretion system protein TssA [Treponema sp.]